MHFSDWRSMLVTRSTGDFNWICLTCCQPSRIRDPAATAASSAVVRKSSMSFAEVILEINQPEPSPGPKAYFSTAGKAPDRH